MLLHNFFLLDSLSLQSGKEYNLNVVKEVEVTQDFLGMEENERNCQNYESFDNCKSRLYFAKLKNTCKCIPFHMMELTYQVIRINGL